MTTHCSKHDSHSEKINGIDFKLEVIKWLMVLMIAANGGMLGYLWSMNRDVSGIIAKVPLYDKVLESKLTIDKEK